MVNYALKVDFPVIENVADIKPMSDEEIQRRTDSLIENIGALRFSLARIEHLEARERLLMDLLRDARVIILETHGQKSIVKQITKVLTEAQT
jgi:hypothetical protein